VPRVKNTDKRPHRVGPTLFPVGEFVETDERTARFVVSEMGFELERVPVADGPVASKPAKGVKK
jgi:hypothetical protein